MRPSQPGGQRRQPRVRRSVAPGSRSSGARDAPGLGPHGGLLPRKARTTARGILLLFPLMMVTAEACSSCTSCLRYGGRKGSRWRFANS